MLTRRALIIGSPDKDIPGVKIDVKNYKDFLLSPLGGQWFSNELVILENPDKTSLTEEIGKLKNVDYSMTIFAGHGRQSTHNSPILIQINEDIESFDSMELNNGAPKRTLILDCCRKVEEPKVNTPSRTVRKHYATKLENARTLYNEAISNARQGFVVMYGCERNQYSREFPKNTENKGGYYSYSLLEEAKKWKRSASPNRVFTVAEVHERARSVVCELTDEQNPTIEESSNPLHFPFAINGR